MRSIIVMKRREFMFISKVTNKLAMKSRQSDSGLRQYNCTGPGQVVGPTWRKMYKVSIDYIEAVAFLVTRGGRR